MFRIKESRWGNKAAVGFLAAGAIVSVSLCFRVPGRAQTAVDLRTQSRNVDFSAAVSTRPAKTGTVLPAACDTGEFFFKTDVMAGSNLYLCTSANVWTVVQGGGGSSTGPAPSLNSGTLAARPGACAAGEIYFATDVIAGQNVFTCVSSGVWKQLSYTAGGSGVLAVDCAVNPCTVDVLTSVLPRLSSTNNWTGTNSFADASALRLPAEAGATPLVQSSIAMDTNTNRLLYGTGTASRVLATMSGTPGAEQCAKWDASGNLTGSGTLCGPVAFSGARFEPFGPILETVADPGPPAGMEVRYFGLGIPYSVATLARVTVLSTAQEAGRGFVVGIYDRNCARVGQSNTVESAAAGETASFTFSPALTLPGGYYYLAYATDCTTCGLAHLGGTSYGAMLNSDATPHSFSGANAATQPGGAGTAITLPATCGAKTALTGAAAQPPVAMFFN